MTPQELKNSILQLAIQGKLVEQRPEEGTGEELYQQIQKEKQALIKAGKIKKGKPLPEITEDEVPFEIPETWKWVRVSELAVLENGDRSSKYPVESDYVDYGIPFIGAKDINGIYVSFANTRYITEEKYCELGNGKLQDKDIICLLRGSVGKCAVFEVDEKHTTGFICAQMIIIRCIIKSMLKYVFSYFQTPYYMRMVDSKVTGTAVRQLPGKELGKLFVPLPPLAEQKRIVAKIEELLPLIDRYEQAWTRLEDFNKRFPADMQKSILQMAIQGKLVEQRPEEGTGEELYQQIQREKQALIQTGKLKKDRRTNSTDMPEGNEVLFDFPESWKLVYLGSVLNKLTDGTHKTPKYATNGVKFVSVKDMSSGVLQLCNTKYITASEHEELYARCDPARGDMLLSKVGTTGVPAIVDTDEPFSLFVSVALLKYNHDCIDETFLYYLLKSPLVQMQAADNTRGVGNKNWILDAIAKTVVVLPPLAEQKRIVARLEELLPLCEGLK